MAATRMALMALMALMARMALMAMPIQSHTTYVIAAAAVSSNAVVSVVCRTGALVLAESQGAWPSL